MAGRTRNWSVIGYPESLKMGWLDILSEKGVQAIISPLHDKDVFIKDIEENGAIVHHKGDLKKAHFHIIFIFDSVKTSDQVYNLVKEISVEGGAVHPIAILNLRSSVRYLIHKDNPDKAQYQLEDVINIGGVDLEKYITSDKEKEEDINERFLTIFNLIQEEDIDSFNTLVSLTLGLDYEYFSLVRKNAFFFSQIIKDRFFQRQRM